MHIIKKSIFAVLILIVILTACQGTQEDANIPDDSSRTQEKTQLESSSGELIVYSGRSESLVQPIIEQFMKESGIDVRVRYGGTAELAATLMEEGGASPADIYYAQDPGGMGAVEAAGLLTPLPTEIREKVPEQLVSPDGMWIGISGRARTIVYNTDQLSPADLPQDLWGFTQPEWKGRLGWAPTNGSFQAMVSAMRAIWGEDQTRDWLEAMQMNEPIAYEKNTPIVAAVGSGEIAVGLVNHYYLHRFIAEEGEQFAARNYFLPNGGPGSLILVSGAGVLQSATNEVNALRFIEFLLSHDAQQYFTEETFEYPLIEGVETSPILTPLTVLQNAAADVSLVNLADLEGTVNLLMEAGILP
jgi:iron(III) transport system substrate-binding protein